MRNIATYIKRHHMGMLALFFALGGTSFAAATLLPRNSVGTLQVKNGSLQRIDLNKKAVAALRGNRGARGPAGARGAQGLTGARGATGAAGAVGATGAAGQSVAYARVDATGTLIGGATQSKGVTQTMIQHTAGASAAEVAGTGVYCFGGLGFTVKSAVVALDNTDAMPAAPTVTGGSLNFIPSVAVFKGEDLGYCDNAHGQARVALEQVNDTAAPALVNHGFFIWFE